MEKEKKFLLLVSFFGPNLPVTFDCSKLIIFFNCTI